MDRPRRDRQIGIAVRVAHADTPWVHFDEIPRYRLYGLNYTLRSIPVADLRFLHVIDLPFVDDVEMFIPNLGVYAVRTNERRSP